MTSNHTHNRYAMVLAAGLGQRLRPLTNTFPKPLISVGGSTMIDRILDHLVDGGITHVVVNTHHMAGQIEMHLERRLSPKISILHENELLDTGGGVAHALPLLGSSSFLVTNSDVILLNGVQHFIRRMREVWRPHMLALLLVHPTVRSFGYNGFGDFMLDPDGKMRRRNEMEVAPYLFTGVQILHRDLFDNCPSPPFSLNKIYDRAQSTDGLYGIVHDGAWMHVGTLNAVASVDSHLSLLT